MLFFKRKRSILRFILKAPYNANSTFIVLLYVHMRSWHVSQTHKRLKKTIHAACCDSSMSDTIRLSALNFFVLHEHVIGPHAYVGECRYVGMDRPPPPLDPIQFIDKPSVNGLTALG